MFIALLGRDTTRHRTEKVGTIISPTNLLLDSGLVTLLKKRCYIYRKGGSDLIWGGFSKSLQRRRIQFPVLDPAKLTPSIKTSRRYIGSHINHSTLSSSDKAQSHPLSSTFIHFIHCPGPFVATCQPQVLVELPSPCGEISSDLYWT